MIYNLRLSKQKNIIDKAHDWEVRYWSAKEKLPNATFFFSVVFFSDGKAPPFIPGARTIEQVEGNLGACGLPKVSEVVKKQVKEVYDATVKAVIEKEKW